MGLALTGCAQFRPEPLSPGLSAAALDSRSLDNPRLRRLLQASQERTSATDWNLDTLTLAALYYHPDLAVARAKLDAAQADIVTARQRPNPSLSLAAAFNGAAVAGALPPGALPLTVGPVVNFLIEKTLSGYTAAIAVNIVGNDLDTLDRKAREVAQALGQVRGAT